MDEAIRSAHVIHQITKKARGSIPLDPSRWPQEWKEIHYKEYPRFPLIPLERTHPSADFFALLRKRTSQREFSRSEIRKHTLSTLLEYSCGINLDRGDRRMHPSGGGRYPLEYYPLLFVGSEELPSGVYHYDIKRHGLSELQAREFSELEVESYFSYPWTGQASLALVITASFKRTEQKYADRGYRYVMLEAGHVAQNVYLTAEALGLRCTAIGGTKDSALESLIDIDGVTESLVYALVIG
jgi:SagB-type dehydrogenase family enzyme